LITVTFTLPCGIWVLFAFLRGIFSQNQGQGNIQRITEGFKHNWWSRRTNWELFTSRWCREGDLKFLFLKFVLVFLISCHARSKLCAMNLQVRWVYCSSGWPQTHNSPVSGS
jgi:hypothetical protein